MNFFSLLFLSCISFFIFVALATQWINSTLQREKTAFKLLHHIRYKCFNFWRFFLPSIHSCNKKNSNPFLCGEWLVLVFALPANQLFFVYCRNQQRNYNWHHRLLVSKWMKMVARKKRRMQDINNFFPPDLLITLLILLLLLLLMDGNRLIYFGFWSIWPLEIGSAEFYCATINTSKKTASLRTM